VFRASECSVPSERSELGGRGALLKRALLICLQLVVFGSAPGAASADELHVPPGFSITVVSRNVPHARFMAFAPNGDLVVSELGLDRVVAIPKSAPIGAEPRVVLDGVPIAHGVAFRGDDLYVAGWAGVTRLRYPSAHGEKPTVLFSDMPQGPVHNHRALAIAPDGGIFVSSGSTCNVCIEDDPRLAAVLRYDADGSRGRIYASGLRNASGLTFDDDGKLWAVVNERDWLGDDLPPDEIVEVKDGGYYGWPYCRAADGRPVPNPEYNDELKCAKAEPSALVLQAHSAPLQIAFYRRTQFPARYRGALFVAYHGSWNRSVKTGYKVVAVFFANGRPQRVEDFATGWLRPDQRVTGRPAGLAISPDGSLYISDDLGGTIYKVTYR